MTKLIISIILVASAAWGQTKVDYPTQIQRTPALDARTYDFRSQTPGTTLSAGIPNTVTMTPCPLGVNGTDSGHYLYVSGGTGTAEAVLINGGTCTSGATTGTVIFTPTYAHSGAWTVASATEGGQEAIQVAQTAGGGSVDIGGATSLAMLGNITITGNYITLQVSGAGLSLSNGSSIVLSGTGNALVGRGNTLITATTTAGDIIRLTGCLNCSVEGFYLYRSATPAVSGSGINFASGTNTNFKGNNLTIRYHYRGIWAQVAPVASAWTNIEIEHNVAQGIQFDADNDEHMTNVLSFYNGGHGLQIGKGSSTDYCIGGFRVTNLVTFQNSGDGVHIEGAAASPCTYVFLNNSHLDTDTGYELYVKNTGAVTISGSEFINGKGIYLTDGASGVFMSSIRVNGSTREGMLITGTATRVMGSAVQIANSSQGSAGVYTQFRVNGTANNINFAGLSIGAPDVASAGGILIESAASEVFLNGTNLFNTGNMTTPVSIASGLTNVAVDSISTWQTLSLLNSWSALTGVSCRPEFNGNAVRLKGTLQAGTVTDGTALFTLPVGCRPSVTVRIPVTAINGSGVPAGTAHIQIASSGSTVIYGFGANTYLSIDGATFSQ